MNKPDSRDVINQIHEKVKLYLSVNRFDAAEKLLKASITDYGPLSNLHNLLGVTFHKQSRFIDAVLEFNRALIANPNFVEAGLNLTMTLCDLSRYDEARLVFDKLTQIISAQKQQPGLILGRIANQHSKNGKLYEDCGMIGDAIQEYRKALQLFDDLPDVRLSLAKLYIRITSLDKARGELDILVNKEPDNSEAHTWLGIIHYKSGRPEEAKSSWEKASKIDPNNQTSRSFIKIAQRLNL